MKFESNNQADFEELAALAEHHIHAGRLDLATQAYEKMLDQKPGDADIHHILGLVHAERTRWHAALQEIQKAIALNPNKAVFFRSLGDVSLALENYAEALNAYARALQLQPDDVDALLNMGNLCHKTGNSKQALQCYTHIIKIHPDYHKALNNIGKVYFDEGDAKSALTYYNMALRQAPNYAEARFNRAVASLLSGDYTQGWPDYEWRHRRSNAHEVYPHKLSSERWQGQKYKGQTLLVHCEQGMGDTLQFARYLPMVKARGGKLFFEVQPDLLPLFKNLAHIDGMLQFNARRAPDIAHHYHIPLLSLPLIFNTNLSTIPAEVPYLHADSPKIAYWRHIMKNAGRNLKVGIVWASSALDPKRNCPLEACAPWFHIPGVQFYSIQKGPAARELHSRFGRLPITDLGDRLDDFDDTAGVIANLDVIVSVDTAVAHLAGAMGKPLLVMLPFVADWRWLTGCSESPWYPTARLIRQQSRADWNSVVNEVGRILKEKTLGCSGKRSQDTANNLSARQTICEEVKLAFKKGCDLLQAGHFHDAIAEFKKAVALNPHWSEAYSHLGLAYQQINYLDQAAEAYEQAIGLNPAGAVYNNLGVVKEHQNDLKAAERYYRKCLDIEPDNADAHYNLGNIYLRRYELDHARQCFTRALACNPDHIKALCNQGRAYHLSGLFERAVACFEKALAIRPDYAEARFNRAITLLLQGYWSSGWPEYEWRFRCHNHKRLYPHHLSGRRWDGCSFKGQTLLVHSEQGIGDALQFVRFLPRVKSFGGRVVFEARKSLINLFRCLKAVDDLIELSHTTPPQVPYDYYIPLCSLGGIFQCTPASVASQEPYLFADRDKTRFWKKQLPAGFFNVGLVWGGNDTYKERSCTLSDFSPLSEIEGINWIGLQKGPAADQIRKAPFLIENWGSKFNDFSDTAAAMDCLDLIISIDTSVAHLAGAMGKPVWVLLPAVPDWRWLTNRNDSPWYSNMRLFRRSRGAEWKSVISQLTAEFQRWRRK